MAKRLTLSFRTGTPPQWEKFIKEYSDQVCEVDCPSQVRVTLNDARWRLMCAVQREVNMTTRYVRDPEGNDHWKLLLAKRGNKGDCEDFALTKRALLLEAGFPVGAVWPVICMERDVPHMVTVVSTTKADYVMDFGWHNWVYDVTDSTLKWLSAYDGQFWRLVSTTIQMDAVSDGPKLDSRS